MSEHKVNQKKILNKFDMECIQDKLDDAEVNLSIVSNGISCCCKSTLHVETTGEYCNIACKKCGGGLKLNGVCFRYSNLAKVVNDIRKDDKDKVRDWLNTVLTQAAENARREEREKIIHTITAMTDDIAYVDSLHGLTVLRQELEAINKEAI